MIPTYQYTKLAKYPHMKPNDVEIWDRFIRDNPEAYDSVQYDVAVGSAPDFDVTVGDSPNATALQLYKRKIDVVGFKNGRVDIIEIKPSAGSSALGQVLGYVLLYKRDIKLLPEPRPCLLTDKIGIDIQELADHMGVTILLA